MFIFSKRHLIFIGGSSMKDGVKRMLTAVTTSTYFSGKMDRKDDSHVLILQ